MKKSLIAGVLMAASVIIPANAQLVYDSFSYTVGGNLTAQTGWSALNSGTPPIISSGNLAVSGLAAPEGNHSTWGTGNIQEALKAYDSQTSGTIFYSFAFQLSALPTATTYTFALSTGNTNYGAPVWFQAAGENFNIGLSNRSNSTPNYSSVALSLNTTYFVVGSYTFNPLTGDDSSALWLNPSSADFSLETAPTATLTAVGGTDLTAISQFLIRGAAGSPSGAIDELRIGTTWTSVTPIPEPSTYLLLGLGAAFMMWNLRRRRSAQA